MRMCTLADMVQRGDTVNVATDVSTAESNFKLSQLGNHCWIRFWDDGILHDPNTNWLRLQNLAAYD